MIDPCHPRAARVVIPVVPGRPAAFGRRHQIIPFITKLLRSSRRSARPHRHVCPIGMRCSCVPIHFDGRLVGVARLVADSRTSDAAFAAAIGVLTLVVSETCQNGLVSVLSEEVRNLRLRVADFERTQSGHRPNAAGPVPPAEPAAADAAEAQNAALVDRALAYLQGHYRQPDLSLSAVSKALGCNPRYLTSRFTRVVGERMHVHLLAFRVALLHLQRRRDLGRRQDPQRTIDRWGNLGLSLRIVSTATGSTQIPSKKRGARIGPLKPFVSQILGWVLVWVLGD